MFQNMVKSFTSIVETVMTAKRTEPDVMLLISTKGPYRFDGQMSTYFHLNSVAIL